MPLRLLWEQATPLPGDAAARRLALDAAQWRAAAASAAGGGARMLALWAVPAPTGAGGSVHAALLRETQLLVLELALADGARPYPGLQEFFPVAARLQRAAADLTGLRADAADQRPWLRHAAWDRGQYPLRDQLPAADGAAIAVDDYEFVRVAGDGVHEVPVGPVHAGVIEPGHFRFSVVGEKVLRLEQRLGYVHKGITRRFTQLPALAAHALAARVSGDSAVAGSWAYCQALEQLAGAAPPPRALWLRALCLEIERLQNHLGDLGALGNDAGFAFGLAQFSRLKEALLRACQQALGQRYLLDAIVPGGVSFELTPAGATTLGACVAHTAATALVLREIYDEHAGVRDRFVGAGRVPPALARRLGLIGLAGRASGLQLDLRVDRPWAPYDALGVRRQQHDGGDVAARASLRFDELQESCRLVQQILGALPDGQALTALRHGPEPGLAIGLIEGWRGPVLVALECGPAGVIRHCHVHDPSWQNWPALEHAVIDNIVPDFPLINKSFNLSYSGHDL
jgi:Ni,Fe-hydrogenase III large subunit